MKKADQDFYEYALSKCAEKGTAAPKYEEWIKEIAQQYSERLACPLCGNEKVDVIMIPKVFIGCEACHTRNEISFDKLQPRDYNAVILLHEDKIIDILEAKGIRID